MKRLLKTVIQRERGQILILSALIIMFFASFTIVPILGFMGTGLNTTKNTGLHIQEIYAAEAGVYDAFWKIMVIVPGLPKWHTHPPMQYSIDEEINSKSVDVTISKIDADTYRVHSVATDPNTNHQSIIESDVSIGNPGGLDFSAFATFAMTSKGTITGKTSNYINGDVWIPSSDNYSAPWPSGDLIEAEVTGWPPVDDLSFYYSVVVDTLNPYVNSTIDISDPALTGPLYVSGIGNKNYTMTGTGDLTGPIYVDGNLYLDAKCTVGLNTKTIFVAGDVSTHPQATVAGPGAILALGNVTFSPQVTPSFLFIMSVCGSISFQPSGAFVGALSACLNINLQPNASVTWEDPGFGNLDLPGLYNHIRAIKTWSITNIIKIEWTSN